MSLAHSAPAATAVPAVAAIASLHQAPASARQARPPAPAPTADTSKRTVSPAVHLLAGGLGGCMGALITCPFELVKTRLQSSAHTQLVKNRFFYTATSAPLSGTVDIVRSIYKTEGLWAFWKGIGPTLLGVIPARAIYFATYNEAKRALTKLNGGESSAVYMGSAISAGVATTISTSPIWLVKTRMQLQSNQQNPRYRSSWDCLTKVVREEGFFSLYRGLSASLIGISEGTIQWLIYEELKKLQAQRRDLPPASAAGASTKSLTDWVEYFACAAVAKLTAATLTYPHEVIRTRLREPPAPGAAHKYTGFWQAGKLIAKEEGARALYGGMGVHLLRVVPNSAIMFLCYEGVVHLAQHQ
ncbi:hypothetical protein AMAG_10431 [Allomyces macrogynus ATCC 38327]|uniref:Mitochondrial carrier protein n=2 Tax=Allomyces macrogynus (strain ATCC 38327) TaxID=578462 RepID=A0A0L0SUP6_ALLM3|nr:hypothetical protein AMAG_10431 [Allomyces macrogynus ATCC 38327]|eukprot:KNE66186.1 hypothetical protein AMAG_10431 [Allomyces macrogynus ATCC 38327]